MNYRLIYFFTVISFLLILASCSKQTSTTDIEQTQDELNYKGISTYFHADWAQDTLWDDGLAEVAIYDAERVVYGKKRTFEYTLITVKEEFNKEHNVKTDDYTRPDLFTVMKVNLFCRIPTESYPYHYLTSIFIHRAQPWSLHKLTTSSQEWCGNTFKTITNEGDHFKQYYNSYFDGQGEGDRQLSKELLIEDQLSYSLRAMQFKEGTSFKMNLLETQQTNKAGEPAVYRNATVSSRKIMLNSDRAWLVEVTLDEKKKNRYWFATDYPNHLLQQETWDGRTLKLKKISRYAYWQD